MYANTCWGLLTLAVTFGVAVLSLPTEYNWLAPWFISAAMACGIASVVCFGWPMRDAANRDKLKTLIRHPLKAIILIEPQHVIIIGLLIAACGVAWQMRARPTVPQSGAQNIQTTLGIGSPPDENVKTVQWNQIFGTTRAVDRVFALLLDGHGPASRSIKLKRAYLESAKTGEVIEMKIAGENMADNAFLISESNPIPPNGFIRLVATMNPSDNPHGLQNGLLNKDFLDRWGHIWFNAVYDEGKPDRISCDTTGYFPEISGPHVTRRSDTKRE